MQASNTAPSIEQATAEFQAGLTAALRCWSVLRTAVNSEWGGIESKQKAEDLRAHIAENFDYRQNNANPKMDLYDLEDALFDYMEEQFSIKLEDKSEQHLAQLIYELYQQCGNGDFILARKNIEDAQKLTGGQQQKAVVQTNGELDEESDDEMDTDMGNEATFNVSPMTDIASPPQPVSSSAQEYAAEYLFGAPAGVRTPAANVLPPRQLGEDPSERPEPEMDDDGFISVPTKRKGKK